MTRMHESMNAALRLRRHLRDGMMLPFVGIYDAFSASLAAAHFSGLFVSGFGYAASHYGLPDIGFLAWPDVVDFVRRLKVIVPDSLLLVDIDDGYSDSEVAQHVASLLERAGAAGIVMEDQQRPRQCGHLPGKRLLPLDQYVNKLKRVLAARTDLVVVARTDAEDEQEVLSRVRAFDRSGADVVLVDGIRDIGLLTRVRQSIDKPIAYNHIAGGSSPPMSTSELHRLGVTISITSTPCLFAAQQAINTVLTQMKSSGTIPSLGGSLQDCTAVLNGNLVKARGGGACHPQAGEESTLLTEKSGSTEIVSGDCV